MIEWNCPLSIAKGCGQESYDFLEVHNANYQFLTLLYLSPHL